MSNVESEARASVEQRLEALAELGIFRVGEAILEKTHLDGTLKWSSATIEGALEQVEAHLAAHPGVFGHTVSRSDGTHETVDNLRVQAGGELKTETPSGAGFDVADASVNTGAGPNVTSPAAPEPEVDPTGAVSETPGDTATGRVGTEADTPAEPASDLPEGAIQS